MNEKKFFELVKNLVADYTNEHLDKSDGKHTLLINRHCYHRKHGKDKQVKTHPVACSVNLLLHRTTVWYTLQR